MNPMWNEDDRRMLAELCRQDDRLRAEHHEWMARRKSPASLPMRETDDAGVIYRDSGGRVLQPAPEPEHEASYVEPEFNAVQREQLAQVVAELQREFDEAIERAQQRILQTVVRLVRPGEIAEQRLYALDDRISFMEAQIERRISKALTDQGIIDLPRDFWKRNAA